VQLDRLISAILKRRDEIPATRALLVGLSGTDASGKGFVANRVAESLGEPTGGAAAHYNVAVIGADGWLNLPHIRFATSNCGEHFYHHAFRFDEMFERLVLPLRDRRSIDLEMDFTEETANVHRRHRYDYRDIDVILLEGIFLFQPRFRHHFDLRCWIDCSFETALARALHRCQEGLSPFETVRAFETIYFPAQRFHLSLDNPRAMADLIVPNDGREMAAVRQGTVAAPPQFCFPSHERCHK
jgi:uridine kinase